MPRAASAVVSPITIRTVIDRCRTEGRAQDFKVEGEPGLWLRVSAKGVAAWSLVYLPKGRKTVARYGLGRFPAVSFKDAREMSRAWLPKIAEGIDPRDVLRESIEKQDAAKAQAEADAAALAARITVAQAVEGFALAKRSARSIEHMKGMLTASLVADYGDKALADLTRTDIEALHEKIVARGAARHADNTLSVVRSLLSWAVKRRHVTENVAARFERAVKHGEGIRERKLTAAEVRALWVLLDDQTTTLTTPVRRIIRLAMLLGSRASEVAGMRRGELSADLMVWTIPAERMKAKRTHVLPLPPMARSIIAEALAETEGPFLFAVRSGKPPRSSSLAHSMDRLNQRLAFIDADGKPAPVKMHDMRRTLATGLQQLGVNFDVVKAALAHTQLDDVTRSHYAQSDLASEVREALTRWQATVTRMVRGEDPFAVRAEDVDDMEARILGQDRSVTLEPASAPNVVTFKCSAG